MIRINLLPTERRIAKAAPRGLSDQHKVAIGGGLALLATAVLIGGRYWMLEQESARLDREIQSARTEEQRLAEIIKQVQDFERRRSQLQERVALIEELRKGQTAPVHILDQVSRAVPDMLWLTKMSQSGFDVTLEGRCLSMTALSDFVANLEESRYFGRPVEIVSSQMVNAPGGPQRAAVDQIQFTVKATFRMAGLPAPAPARARQARPAGGAPRG